MSDLPLLQVADGASLHMMQVMDDDLLSADTKAIRVRGPRGVVYAKNACGAWRVVGAKELRSAKEMGVA